MEDTQSATAQQATAPRPDAPSASAAHSEHDNQQPDAAGDKHGGSAAPEGSVGGGSRAAPDDSGPDTASGGAPGSAPMQHWKSQQGFAASPEPAPVTVWKRAKDPRSGKEYYADLSTRQTQWRRPTSGWLQTLDAASGRSYYCNLETRETRWSDPRAESPARQAATAPAAIVSAAPARSLDSSALAPGAGRRRQDTLRHLATSRTRHVAAARAQTGPIPVVARRSSPAAGAAAPSQQRALRRKPRPPPSEVTHRDFGLKQAGTSGGWKHRYFVLANQRMDYYDEPGGEPKGSLSLHPFAYVCKSTIANGSLCLFTPQRVLYFSGETPHATQRWRRALKQITTRDAQRPIAGVLRKRMANTHQWKERYVVLFGMSLLWFSWKGGDFKGRMSLDSTHLTRASVDGHSLCFKLRWTTAAKKRKVVFLQAANEAEFKLWQQALLRHMKYEGRQPPTDPEARREMRRRHRERREREAAERRAEAEARREAERLQGGAGVGEEEEEEGEEEEEEGEGEGDGISDRYGRPALWRRLTGQTPERRTCGEGARVNPLGRAGSAWEQVGTAKSRERARLRASTAVMTARAGRLHRLAPQRRLSAGSKRGSSSSSSSSRGGAGGAPGRRRIAARVAGVARTMQAKQVRASTTLVEAASAADPVQAAPTTAAAGRVRASVIVARDMRRASAVPMLGAVPVAVASGQVMCPSLVRHHPASSAARDVAKAVETRLDVSARRQLASLTPTKLAVAIRVASGQQGGGEDDEVASELGSDAMRGLAAVASRAEEVRASLGTGDGEGGDGTHSLVGLALSYSEHAEGEAAAEAVATEAAPLREDAPRVATMSDVAKTHAAGSDGADTRAESSGGDDGPEPGYGEESETVMFVSAGGGDEDSTVWEESEEEEEEEEEEEVEDVAVMATRSSKPTGAGGKTGERRDDGTANGGAADAADGEGEVFEGEEESGEEEEKEGDEKEGETGVSETAETADGEAIARSEEDEVAWESPAVAEVEGTKAGQVAVAGKDDEAGGSSSSSSFAPAHTSPRSVKQSAAVHNAAEPGREGGEAPEPRGEPNFTVPSRAPAEAEDGLEAVGASTPQGSGSRAQPEVEKSLLQGVSKIQKIVLARAQNTLLASGPLSVCPADEVGELVAACDALSYKEGDVVVTSASADASCLFFVVGGVVSVVGAASRTYHRELVRRYNGDAFGAKNVIQSRLYGAFYCTARTNLECLRLTPAALSILGRVVGRSSVLYGVLRMMMEAASGTVGAGDDSEGEGGSDLDEEEEDKEVDDEP